MRGRWQAAAVACVGSFVPVVSPAAVGLVALRHGSAEAAKVVPWALLPSLVLLANAGPDSLLTLASIAVVSVVALAALVLRSSVSWASTVIAITACSTLAALLLVIAGTAQLTAATQLLAEMLEQLSSEQAPLPVVATPLFVAGLFGWMVAVGSLIAVLVARWWQSLLYNPGGFGSEFRQLRLSSSSAVALLAIVALAWLQAVDYRPWAELLALPLLLSGLSLLHYTAAARGLGRLWLGMIYVGLVFFSPLNMVIIGLACADSLINIRSRVTTR